MTDPSTLADELRRRRRTSGMTQEELAETSGVSVRTITDLERDIVSVPRRDTLNLLAAALELPEEDRQRWHRYRHGSRQPRTISKSTVPQSNLPEPPNRLIGRKREVQAITALLWRNDVRLVCVTGAGGVGKTRVALEVARAVDSWFPGGVIFVDLTALRDPAAVLSTIADHLNLQVSSSQDVALLVAARLEQKASLLVIDNFEHVLRAAPDISSLLRRSSESKFLLTSRARLQVQDEHEYSIPTLALPQTREEPAVEAIERYSGVRLFLTRANQAGADLRLTDENRDLILGICGRLDGLPLAIELAAARTRVLSLEEMLPLLKDRLQILSEGFRDAPDRHRTMRDAITWSYRLLDPVEQALFRALSVFVGGWTLSGAEAMSDSDPSSLDRLTSLVDSNLIYRQESPAGETRFGMLETIREFGLEQASETDESSILRRFHANYYLALANEAVPHLLGPDPSLWLRRIEAEMPNFRLALEWAHESACREQFGAELAGALSWYWMRLQGDISEGRQLLVRALGRATAGSRARMMALAGFSWIAHMQHDHAAGRTSAQEALALAHELNDRWYTAWCLHLLGRIAYFSGDSRTAHEYAVRMLSISREANYLWLTGWAHQLLGISSFIADDLVAARADLETSLDIWESIQDQPGIAALHALLGVVSRLEGDYEKALNLFQESLARYQALGARWFTANFIAEVIAFAERLGEPRRAAELSGFVEENWTMTSAGPAPFTEVRYLRSRRRLSEKLDPEDFADAMSAGRMMTLDEAIDEALQVGRSPFG